MTKKAAGVQAKPQSSEASAAGPSIPAASVFRPPFKPHPKMLYGLVGVLVLWVGVLVVLYVKTVYPQRGTRVIPVQPAPAPLDQAK